MKTEQEAIKLIEEIYGESQEEICERTITDSLVPGICMNDSCEYTYEYEPDQDKGYCEGCDTGSVKSLYNLMGII